VSEQREIPGESLGPKNQAKASKLASGWRPPNGAERAPTPAPHPSPQATTPPRTTTRTVRRMRRVEPPEGQPHLPPTPSTMQASFGEAEDRTVSDDFPRVQPMNVRLRPSARLTRSGTARLVLSDAPEPQARTAPESEGQPELSLAPAVERGTFRQTPRAPTRRVSPTGRLRSRTRRVTRRTTRRQRPASLARGSDTNASGTSPSHDGTDILPYGSGAVVHTRRPTTRTRRPSQGPPIAFLIAIPLALLLAGGYLLIGGDQQQKRATTTPGARAAPTSQRTQRPAPPANKNPRTPVSKASKASASPSTPLDRASRPDDSPSAAEEQERLDDWKKREKELYERERQALKELEKHQDEEARKARGEDETPAEDAPAEDAPAEDAPAEDAPAEDAPAKDAPQ
jgi:hypothetical protein